MSTETAGTRQKDLVGLHQGGY